MKGKIKKIEKKRGKDTKISKKKILPENFFLSLFARLTLINSFYIVRLWPAWKISLQIYTKNTSWGEKL
jgi:hypothetical protein